MRYALCALLALLFTACEQVPQPQCSKLANGMLCRHGMLYGPNVGGVYPGPAGQMTDPVVATCNVADGKPIPCGDEVEQQSTTETGEK